MIVLLKPEKMYWERESFSSQLVPQQNLQYERRTAVADADKIARYEDHAARRTFDDGYIMQFSNDGQADGKYS